MALKFTARRRKIADIFDGLELAYPKKSTEWLIAMTCGQFLTDEGQEIDNSDVCEALIAQGDRRAPTPDTDPDRKEG